MKSIDASFDKFYNKNLEDCEKDDAFDEQKSLYDRLFYFTKMQNGHYSYYIFPQLDLSLIEDKDVVKTYRLIYIN
jgi:hypothetical protein